MITENRKPIILVDMDDTLGEFSRTYWDTHNIFFNENTDYKSVTDWDLSKFSKRGSECYELFKFPGLFRNLPVKFYAKEFINNMQKISDVYIVSDTPEGTSYKETFKLTNENLKIDFPHSNPADDKRNWLKEHFPTVSPKNIIFCGCKWMVYGDVLIDDKPETFLRFKELNRDAILIDMPYNRHIKTKYRAKTLKEAEEMTLEILVRNGFSVSQHLKHKKLV